MRNWLEKPLEWDGEDEGEGDEGKGAEDYEIDVADEQETPISEDSIDGILRPSQYQSDIAEDVGPTHDNDEEVILPELLRETTLLEHNFECQAS